MRVLVVHNHYQQPGGEDRVFADECSMLTAHGHEVRSFTAHNDTIRSDRPIATAARATWNGGMYRRVRALLRDRRADVMHCHNTFPLISPAVYYAARAHGVPVVQTLHNYRLLCPAAVFFRDGHQCERCLGHAVAWHGLAHGCYRGSRAATAAAVAAISTHRVLGTWTREVAVYVALSEFAKAKFVQGGVPENMIVVKPNFVHPDPGVGTGDGGFALFVGRLVPEKGVRTLLAAWERLGEGFPLRIVGDGPIASEVEHAARRSRSIEWLGHRSPEDVAELMRRSTMLICPSEWCETFGRVVIEAFATGTPVIATRIGAIAELIDDGRTGRLLPSGDADALAEQVEMLLADAPQRTYMRQQARSEFEARYTMARNHEMLAAVYRRATAVPA
jgi:glycosyltransferase involved in cell wall biosynthesis